MTGARLLVDRKEELQRHLEAEKEPQNPAQTRVSECLQPFCAATRRTLPSVWHRHFYGVRGDTDVDSGRLARYPGRRQAHGLSAEAR
jgi:hypothetical protein